MTVDVWLAAPLERIFPLSRPARRNSMTIYAPRGGQAAFQVAVRFGGTAPTQVSVEAAASSGLDVRVRRVGCVPVPHHNTETPASELDGVGHIPGFVPDPLFPESAALIPPNQAAAFWITVRVPEDAEPGKHAVKTILRVGDRTRRTLRTTVRASRVVLEPRRDFHVAHWFYADALCDWYGVAPFGKAFWPICEAYMRDYAAHGADTLSVPVFTPPLDGVKRPTQLLRIRKVDGRYRFDWRDVRRWIRLAQKCGIRRFEWTHLFTQWGAEHAIRIYHGQGKDERLLWPPNTGATSPTYRDFLARFLPALHRFLRREDLLDVSFFHLSDEPHGDEHLANYRAARAMVRELAPWMNVMDALSDIRFARLGLTDLPVPSIRTAPDFLADGIRCWTYFCCGPRGRYLQRLLDTPLPKVALSGWLFHRLGVGGFLHWGYNYWYRRQTRELIDPFTVTDGLAWPGWAHGDPFVVYPGPHGPIDSIRWEVFARSLEDLALLQTRGIERDAPLLSPLKSFAEFPRDARWLEKARRRVLFRFS
ncbi:MAG: DUF4091 domain-containing protein [Planctomycetota bacterium]